MPRLDLDRQVQRGKGNKGKRLWRASNSALVAWSRSLKVVCRWGSRGRASAQVSLVRNYAAMDGVRHCELVSQPDCFGREKIDGGLAQVDTAADSPTIQGSVTPAAQAARRIFFRISSTEARQQNGRGATL